MKPYRQRKAREFICPECLGAGWTTEICYDSEGEGYEQGIECPLCLGTGNWSDDEMEQKFLGKVDFSG